MRATITVTRARRATLMVAVVMAAALSMLLVAAAVARAGTAVHLYQVWHAPMGTVVHFKYDGGACASHEFNGSFTVTSNPMVRNQHVLDVPSYHPFESCFYVPSASTWKVTAAPPGRPAHSVKLLLVEKPQLPLNRHDWQVHCSHETGPLRLGCHGGKVPDIIGGWPPVVFFNY